MRRAEPDDTRTGPTRGFTLVELLIVIVVLGILAVVVVYSVRGVTDRGEDSTCLDDRRIVQVAAEAYFAQTGSAAIPAGSPGVAGVSGATPELTLVEVGLLNSPSGLHDVDADGAVTVQAGSRCV